MALLYSHIDESYHLRKVLRLAGVSPGAGQRELKRLSAAGIIVRTVADNQVRFQANRQCPVFGELRSLVAKTAGVAEVLRASFGPVADSIEAALIYGFADRGRVGRESDVEVLVIGEIGLAEVLGKLGPAQEMLGRDVNPTVLSRRELRSRLAAGDDFLLSILKSPLIPIMGEPGELVRIGRSTG